MAATRKKGGAQPLEVKKSTPQRQRKWWVTALVGASLVVVAVWLGVRPPRSATSSTGAALGALAPSARQEALNVVVVTLDTTRWDRLGAYGDRAAQTPNLDRLAAEGVLFEQAITSVPLTLPAHSTLFTGLLPPRHGVRDNGGYVLDPKHTTLAHMLKDGGWKTGAFVGAFVLDGRWGLDQGFDTYVDDFDVAKYKTASVGNVARRANEVTDTALSWLEKNSNDPFFAWIHYYDAHTPYDPPEPYRSRFKKQPYAGEIAFVDSQLGRVLQWLDARDLTRRTIVVAIGDHGESLNEHGEGTHGLFIYESTTRVPFIIRAPFGKTAGRRVSSTVRSEDVMPTLLDLIGRSVPGDIQGRTLVPLMTGAAGDLNLDAYSESLYPRNHYGWSELRALRAGRFKYIAAPKPELYDLERDPGELENLHDQRRSLADRMASELQRLSAETPEAARGPSAVDPETRERLAALGYIGSFTPVAGEAGAALPDPKDKIDIFNLMTAAQESGSGTTDESRIDRLRRVVSLDPKIVDAWVMLGNEYFRLRQFHTALEQFKRALALSPDSDLATINMAATYRSLGDYNAAILGFERYLRNDPKNAWVRYQLGELFVDLNQLEKAEAAFQQALADDVRVASARNALGVVAMKRGDLAKAEREIRAAIAQKPDVKLAHFNLALLAESRKDFQTAIREYRTEIDTQPNAFKAAFNLGKLYEQLGNVSEQEAAFRKAIELNPRFAEGYFYLAKLYLDQGRNYDEAVDLARQGLRIGAPSEFAPLGHYVLADLYNRRGQHAEGQREADRGRAREAELRARRSKTAS